MSFDNAFLAPQNSSSSDVLLVKTHLDTLRVRLASFEKNAHKAMNRVERLRSVIDSCEKVMLRLDDERERLEVASALLSLESSSEGEDVVDPPSFLISRKRKDEVSKSDDDEVDFATSVKDEIESCEDDDDDYVQVTFRKRLNVDFSSAHASSGPAPAFQKMSKSTICCTLCKIPGHNRRTCVKRGVEKLRE